MPRDEPLRRLLLTVGGRRCPFGCAYCFANFEDYTNPLTIDWAETNPQLVSGYDLVYPACDVDLFTIDNWRDLLNRTAALGRSISISTKASLSLRDVAALAAISNQMRMRGAVLKVAVSVSTKSQIARLEPRTASYRRRIENLRILKAANVPSALVLKPLLTSVAPAEYAQIVADVAPYVSGILVGHEYVDTVGGRPTQCRTLRSELAKTTVDWAWGKPTWYQRIALAQENAVLAATAKHGLRVYDSDGDLMVGEFLHDLLTVAASGD